MGKKQMQRGLVVVFMLMCSICLCCCGMTERNIKSDSGIINMSDLQEEISSDGEITKAANADEIPINTDVHSIQITNGTTGEVLELSREIQPEAFWEIMQKYESLDAQKSENQTPWVGYSYRLQLLDEEGKELYSVYPKGQYIEINNIRYEDFEKTTTVELMLAVDACWKEDLPMGDLVETERQELDVIEGFSMNVTYATCRGVSLQFTNRTDKNIMMGDSYSLQIYQDGKWYEVDYLIDNWAFTAIGYEMPPESTRSLAVKWEVFHGELEPGNYRIVKDVNDFRGTGDYTEYYVGAEFIIP